MSTGRLGAGDTAIQPTILDAKGDLIVATAADTPARLAVGSANQVLTVDSSTSTGLKWATPATDANGLVLIKRATFSGVSDTGTTYDDVFTSTYETYNVVYDISASTNTADLRIQYRYAGPTTQATGYEWTYQYVSNTTTPAVTLKGGATTYAELSDFIDISGFGTQGRLYFNNVLSTGSRPFISFMSYSGTAAGIYGGSLQTTSRTYTGFILSPSTGTISGTVSVYGLAKS